MLEVIFLIFKLYQIILALNLFCSDFRYKSNGIFVLGVGFFLFLSDKFRKASHFWRIFLFKKLAFLTDFQNFNQKVLLS